MVISPVEVFTAVAVVSELFLLYINYLARVRYKDYFVELTPVWRWFDRKGFVHVALILSFTLNLTLILVVGQVVMSEALLGFLAGVICCNAMLDTETFRHRFLCVKVKCDKLDKITGCGTCELQDQYNVSLISLKLTKKRGETKFRQEYPHVIGFFKWVVCKVLRRKNNGSK